MNYSISCQKKKMFFFMTILHFFNATKWDTLQQKKKKGFLFGLWNIHKYTPIQYLLLWHLLIWIGYYCARYIDQSCLSNRLGLPKSLVDVLSQPQQTMWIQLWPTLALCGVQTSKTWYDINFIAWIATHVYTLDRRVFSFFLIHLFFLLKLFS